MIAAAFGVALLLLAQSAAVTFGTIRGRVINPDGQPTAEVTIRVVEPTNDRGFLNILAVTTDEDGRFETRAPTGSIMLIARPRSPHRTTSDAQLNLLRNHPEVYFPGVLNRLDAWPIDVKAGEIIELDFHLPPVSIGSIKAVVSGPDDSVLEQVRVMRPEANEIKNVNVSSDGIGYVDGLREGRYIVAARGRSKNQRLAAWQIVHITGGEIEVALPLAHTAIISGYIITEDGGSPPIDAWTVRVEAEWTDGNISLDPLASDDRYVGTNGVFSIDGLFGRRRLHVFGLSYDWRVSAIRHGRSDITSTGIELAAGTMTEITIVVSPR
jgi:hypothetical protein